VTTGDLIIGALLTFLLSKKSSGSSSSSKTTKADEKASAKAADALTEMSQLQKRANQEQAQAWIPDLEAAGAPSGLARALARWIGIESSGYPAGDTRAVSKKGERGLLQIMPETAKEALTPAEWQELGDAATSRAEQARIALKQFRWHQEKAKKYVKDWPGDDTFDSVFYAKLHHQRPKDLSDAKPAGPAATATRQLLTKWKNDPAALKRLAAANVVTWGSITAP
jgi:hypothetical protein